MSQKYTLADFPSANTYRLEVPALAAGVGEVLANAVAPFDGYVSQVQFVPNAAIVGVATNNRTLRVVNKTHPVSGGVAATLTLDGTNGTNNIAAMTPLNIPVVAAPVDNVNPTVNTNYVAPTAATPTASTFQKGDVLDWESNVNGTGLADPGGVVVLTLQRFE